MDKFARLIVVYSPLSLIGLVKILHLFEKHNVRGHVRHSQYSFIRTSFEVII